MNSSISKLVALNPTFLTKDGFYSPARDETEIKVEFTDAAEQKISAQISALDDLSCFSEEFEQQVGDGEHLSVLRAQALLAFDFSNIETALEISHDHGNICRFLAEKTVSTDSLKNNKSVARATSYRCSELSNVGILCADFATVELPNNYYDLIVLSDIETLVASSNQIQDLIARLSDSLNDKGILLFNVQNPQPVSAWFNQDQDLPYGGLYGTLTNRLLPQQWLDMLGKEGLSNSQEYCVLPNTKQPRTILSKDYVETNVGAINHFYGAGFIGQTKVNEYLLFSELSKTRNLYELCDSYLIIAGKDTAKLSEFYNSDFSHFSSPGRRREWRTLTNKRVGESTVTKELLFKDISFNDSAANGVLIKQNLAKQEYQTGQSLAGLWLQCLVKESSTNDQAEQHTNKKSTEKFAQYLKEYHAWLSNNHAELNNALYDILPFNQIVNTEGEYQLIDAEWEVEANISPEFVLFRALFWFGFHNRHLLKKFATEHGLFSLQDFVVFGLKLNGYDSDIKAFIQLETTIQSGIERQFNRDAIDETMRLPIAENTDYEAVVLYPKTQVFFYNQKDGFDFENSLTVTSTKLAKPERLSFPVSNLNT